MNISKSSWKVFFSLIGFAVLLVASSQPALAQNRPDVAIPDKTGPGEDGTGGVGELAQSGRMLSQIRGNASLGERDDDLPDPDESPICAADSNNPALRLF